MTARELIDKAHLASERYKPLAFNTEPDLYAAGYIAGYFEAPQEKEAEIASLKAQIPKWISVDDALPEEGGRYWCYVEEVNDLGISHYQWNCAYEPQYKSWSDDRRTVTVTHWQHLPAPPSIPTTE